MASALSGSSPSAMTTWVQVTHAPTQGRATSHTPTFLQAANADSDDPVGSPSLAPIVRRHLTTDSSQTQWNSFLLAKKLQEQMLQAGLLVNPKTALIATSPQTVVKTRIPHTTISPRVPLTKHLKLIRTVEQDKFLEKKKEQILKEVLEKAQPLGGLPHISTKLPELTSKCCWEAFKRNFKGVASCRPDVSYDSVFEVTREQMDVVLDVLKPNLTFSDLSLDFQLPENKHKEYLVKNLSQYQETIYEASLGVWLTVPPSKRENKSPISLSLEPVCKYTIDFFTIYCDCVKKVGHKAAWAEGREIAMNNFKDFSAKILSSIGAVAPSTATATSTSNGSASASTAAMDQKMGSAVASASSSASPVPSASGSGSLGPPVGSKRKAATELEPPNRNGQAPSKHD